MKTVLSDEDRKRLERHIAEAEKRTGCQIVLAVIRRSDSYAELPWKAFSLAASVTALAVCTAGAFSKGWNYDSWSILPVLSILLAGAVFALLAVFVPQFARLFLPRHRAKTEVRQYAESLFLRKELSATAKRTGVLLMVSQFERRVVLLPDKGVKPRLSDDTMHDIIKGMISHLVRDNVHLALQEGLERLTLALASPAGGRSKRSRKNETPDQIIEEKGA
jgi:putative membrane protein